MIAPKDPAQSSPQPSRRQFIRNAGVATALGVGAGAAFGRSLLHATGLVFTPLPEGTASMTAIPARGPAKQLVPLPPPPPNPQHWQAGDFINRVDDSVPRVALTFDDGPSPYNTDRILAQLQAVGVQATFFMIGVNVRAWPDIARRVVDAGHEVGNHSVYHTPYQATALANQIGPNQDIIHSVVGEYPVASRAPGLTRGSQILQACAAHNLYECHTDRDTSDWRNPRRSVSTLAAEFERVLHPGLIGLYHDGGPSRPTADGLVPFMISTARGRGYEVMGATSMVNQGTPRPGAQTYYGIAGASGVDEPVPESDALTVTCDYDPRAEMLRRLDDPTVKRAERSRIVEVLADMDLHDRQFVDG